MPPDTPARKLPIDTMDVMMTIAGIGMGILIFTGFLSFQAIMLIQTPPSPFGGTPTESEIAYANVVRVLAWISMAVLDGAVALVVAFAFLASASRRNVPDSARKGLYIFATVFVVGWAFLSYLYMTVISSLLRFYGS